MPNFDLVFNGGQAIVPTASGSRNLKVADVNVGVRGGRIAEVSTAKLNATKVIECKGLVLFPGFIDSQVHFREPGMTHKEDLASGSKGAALGGITSFFEMPNTIPATTTKELFEDKIKRATGRVWTNFAFYVGGSPENVDQLASLEVLPGCAGIKIFMGSSTGTLLVEDRAVLEKILRQGNRRVIVHSEDEKRLRERKNIAQDSHDVHMHPVWRDVDSAVKSTVELLKLARKTNRMVHVLHVSSGEEMEILAQAKDIATVEVLPQHLTFAAPDCYEKLGTKAQQNPPIREARHRDRIWRAVLDGTVTVMGSDHAPHTLAEKAKEYPMSPSGMPMVQTTIPLMLNHINNGKMPLLRLAELMCENPRHVFGCKSKGRIEVGLDADFTLVDLNKVDTMTNEKVASKAGWTPLDGQKLKGWPIASFINGEQLLDNGKLLGQPRGRVVHFEVTGPFK